MSVSRLTSKLAVLSLAVLATASSVHAAYTFPTFTTEANSDLVFTTLNTSAVPAGTYNYVSISLDWAAGPGDPWSNEAQFALSSDQVPTIVHNFLTGFVGSGANGNPTTLTYSGFLDADYLGGNPLEFVAYQSFTGSSATWSNVSLTIDYVEPPPVFTTTFSGDTTGGPTYNRPTAGGSGLSTVGTDVAYEVIPFYVTADGLYDIEIIPTGDLDSILFLHEGSFDPLDPLASYFDGTDAGFEGEGELLEGEPLVTGVQYYIVVAGYYNVGEDFSVGGFDGIISGPATPVLGVIPEPSSLGLLLATFPLMTRRRRVA